MQRFAGRTIVLTGVGREGQVGEVIARAFADEGATLVLVGHGIDEANARAADLRSAGGAAHPEACDLTDPGAVAALAERVAQQHNHRVDAVVHAAGGFAMSGSVADSDLDVWRRQLDINLTTAYLTTRAFLPLLRATRGSLVLFASASALPGEKVADMSAYVVAKTGVTVLARAVAQEERDTGVRANAIAPTAIRTAKNLSTMGSKTRYVEREDVARAALFLCADESRAITGQILRLA